MVNLSENGESREVYCTSDKFLSQIKQVVNKVNINILRRRVGV